MITNNLEYIELSRSKTSDEVLKGFSCGNSSIDIFFHEKAIEWANKGIAVTYILVSNAEKESGIVTKIFAFATISCGGLLYTDDQDNNLYMSCAEIKYFAIKKSFRGQTDTGLSSGSKYSQIFFKLFLQDLYLMSTATIGFGMIYLQANKEGKHLYEDCKFTEIKNYLTPDADSKIEIEECVPMGILMTSSNCDFFFG